MNKFTVDKFTVDKFTVDKFTVDHAYAEQLNYKYGGNWITNLGSIDKKASVKLWATGNATISSGRTYMAFPADKILTHQEKLTYNIIE